MQTTNSIWVEHLADKKALEAQKAEEVRTSSFDPVDFIDDPEVAAEYRRLLKQTPDQT